MGYTTEFTGRFHTSRPLTLPEITALNLLAETRHGGAMQHDAGKPGFWCQWRPSRDGLGLEWDGGEKFYAYVEWLKYIIKHHLAPWGVKLNGAVAWHGEDRGDVGTISVDDNLVFVFKGVIDMNQVTR